MGWIEDLKCVVEVNSYTKNKRGVDRVGNYFKEWFEALGFTTHTHQRELIGDHLHFTSQRKNGERILLLGHLDTVFPEGSFEGFSEDKEWIYGAGVCDMKGGNIVLLHALKAIHNIHSTLYNIDVLLVSDEETGSDDSRALTAELSQNYDYCFVFEAAGAEMEVVIERKGIGTFYIDIEGKASHAGTSYEKGIDANLEAAHKIQALCALTDLSRGTTLNVGRIEGGIGANTIAPSARLTLELRYTSHHERDRILTALKTIVGTSYVPNTKAHLSGGIQRDVMAPSSDQEALLKILESLLKTPLKTEVRGGVSDANITASQGLLTLDGWGPYGDGDHTLNERALKESFQQRIHEMQTILDYHQRTQTLKVSTA